MKRIDNNANLDLLKENDIIGYINKQIKEIKMDMNKKEDDLKNIINEKNNEIKELNNKLINQGNLYENEIKKLNIKISELINKLEDKINEENNKINNKINNIYDIIVIKDKEDKDNIIKEMKNIEKQIDKNKFELNKIISTPKVLNNDFEKIYMDNKDIESNKNRLSKPINVILDDKPKLKKIMKLNNNLENIRNSLKDEIKEDFNFIYNSSSIDKENEINFQVQDIITNDNSIILESKSSEPKLNKKDKYDIIEIREDLKFFRYSKIKAISNAYLVFQHFYDKFDENDYKKAYVVLFIGFTGGGKTTAINAFFNIIKGIKIEDNYRFILIEENNSKNQAFSQTEGIHLYYLKDYNNEPIILIDTQGYGHTGGMIYDEKLNFIFKYVFENIIDHINVICYTEKSHIRLDRRTYYCLSQLSLYSKNMIDNIIFLMTFANKGTIKSGPEFIDRIKDIPDLINFKEKLNWFACDSNTILDNDIDKLTKYSYSQLLNLYEKKIKKLKPKDCQYSLNIIKYRNLLNIETNNLFKIINSNLDKNEIQNKIKSFIIKLKILNENINKLSIGFNSINIKIEYIDSLFEKYELIGYKDNDINKFLKYIRKINKFIKCITELSIEDIQMFSKNQLIELINN